MLTFTHFSNDRRWYCSHCGVRNAHAQKRCASCFKVKHDPSKNKPIVVLDIDETLIASKDKNEKDIYREFLHQGVTRYADSLAEQYQKNTAQPSTPASKHKKSATANNENDFRNFQSPEKTRKTSLSRLDDCKEARDRLQSPMSKAFTLESSREPNPNRYLSPVKKPKLPKTCVSIDLTTPSPSHSLVITRDDIDKYEPHPKIPKDMVYRSKTTKGKFYYIYFRNGAKEFLQNLVGWKLNGLIQLCIMTAANKYYAQAILAKLLGTDKFEPYFDCIVTKEYLPVIRIDQNTKRNGSSLLCETQADENASDEKYRRIKTLDLVYDYLGCDRSVPCIMADDNLRNFDVYDKLMYVYNIVEYRNPAEANARFMDSKLSALQRYIHSLVIDERARHQLIESELNDAYKQYLLNQSDESFKQKLTVLYRSDGSQQQLLQKVFAMKTETLRSKIAIVQEFIDKEHESGNKSESAATDHSQYLDRLLQAIDISSFEYLDRYLMSALIRIKKNDHKAFSTQCELLATVVMFYRLYFVITNCRNMAKYFCSNFNAFLFNLYCCNVLIRYHLCNYDGKQFMRHCMETFANLTVIQREVDDAQTTNQNSFDEEVQKKFGRKIFYHYLQTVMYYVNPPYIFDGMFEKSKIVKLLPSKYRNNSNQYTSCMQSQSPFFVVFEKYTSTLATFIHKAFNAKILK